MTDLEFIKKLVSKHALKYVKKEMIIGLGTGSTAGIFIKELAKLNRREALRVTGVPTSDVSMRLAKDLGINIASPDEINSIDIAFDGADEVDPSLNLIKGGGGALLKEKIVAENAKQMIVLVDESKIVQILGKFPLPIEIVKFGSEKTIALIRNYFKECFGQIPEMYLRKNKGSNFVTEEEHFILDIFQPQITNPEKLDIELNAIVGVVETGLFVNTANTLIVGNRDGSVKIDHRVENAI